MTPEAPPALGGPPDPRGGGPLPRWVDVLTRDRFGKAMLAAVGAAPTGVVFADPRLPDCPIVYANPAFLRLTGYDLTEVLGRNCRFLQGKDSDPAAVFQLRQALAEARPVLLRLVNYRRDGKRFENELHIMPVLGEDGRPTLFVGIQNDVSARLRAEREVERARKEARRISARTSDFLAFMSHEVRTPLNGVMGTLCSCSTPASTRSSAPMPRRPGAAANPCSPR
jgi:PAS domain S-box-containing protein